MQNEDLTIFNKIGSVFFILIISLLLGSLIFILISILQNLNAEVITQFINKSEFDFRSISLFLVKFILICVVGSFLGVFFGYSGSLLLHKADKSRTSTKFLVLLSDCLTRFPAILIGLLSYFILIVLFKMPWHLLTQILIFSFMMIPSVFDSSSVALKTGIKINEGVILSFIRIWIELIIFLFIIILYSGNIISNIIENSVNFNSLINLLCSEGLLFENPENITFLIAAVITITIINALVNWLFKNYAVRAFSRKRG